MKSPLLSILVTSLPERVPHLLLPLWDKLAKQVASGSVAGQVEILVFLDNRQRTVGEKRDALVQMSRGDFVAFCDDDDDVNEGYVSRLVTAIQASPHVDVITFKQEAVISGVSGICTFGLRNPNEGFSSAGFLRAPWQVCAWRGDLARKFRFPATADGEDWAWARHLVLEAKSEHHIPEVLHVYRYDPKVTAATPGMVHGERFTWENIPGWFDFPQLYAFAVVNAQPGATFVELGTYLGRSTAFMLSHIAASGKGIKFRSYDTFEGSPTEPLHAEEVAKHGGSLLSAARSNLAKACGPDGPTALVEADSAAAASLYNDGTVDFLFIDADHTEAAVRRDILAWLPKLKPGAVMAGHDYDCPTVAAAVNGTVGKLWPVQTAGRCWLVVIPECIGGD